MTLYLRKSPETMIFRVAPEEDRDIFDNPVLGSVPVSQGHMGLSYFMKKLQMRP